MVTDINGKIIGRHDYLPFGEEVQSGQAGRTNVWGSGKDNIAQKFTGKERDSSTGLDFFGARYYGSYLGRFTSPDEFTGGFDTLDGKAAFVAGPLPYADISDPQTLNKYTYVRNHPLRYIDPNGHCIEDLCIAEATVTSVVGSALLYFGYQLGASIRDTLNSQYQPPSTAAASQTQADQGQQAAPTRGQALTDAKNDAGVPTSQQPQSQETVR